LDDETRQEQSRRTWDEAAASFDDQPDHGLGDPLVREAWTDFLRDALPYTQAELLDIGCGTGSLSVVLAQLGQRVTGIDLSPAMIARARAKAAAAGVQAAFHVMDAAAPALPGRQFDGIVCRHLLWTLPEPEKVLQRWAGLLKQDGRLVLIEGRWDTGAGLQAREVLGILPASFREARLVDLSQNPDYWGKEVGDERYAVIADKDR
jgi:2-polyprenyl-3-methyl-5-hydroxy-6-metoxy-1,4-benzoquinol methylase